MSSKSICHVGNVKFSKGRDKSGKFVFRITAEKTISTFFRIPFAATISRMSAQDYFEIARRKQKKGSEAQAMKNYRKALEMDRGHEQARKQLADLLIKRKEFEPALLYAPKNVEALLKRGRELIDMGETGGALTKFSFILTFNSDCVDAYLGMSEAYAKDGLHLMAKQYADRAEAKRQEIITYRLHDPMD